MTVTSNDLLVGPVTPAVSTTLISIDFYFEAASDIEVYKTGSETPLTLGVDYTVSLPTAVNATDGSITLLVAADGTDAYSIFGAQPLERSSDLQFRGDLRSPVINVELDRLWRAVQSVKTLAQRTINLARTAPNLPPITFTPGGTDSRAIVFNADSTALVPGATADEIAGAQAAGVAAGNSADAAAASATAAAGSATTASNAADTVAPIAGITTEIEAVAAVDAEVLILAAIAADITAVSGISTDVEDVAAIVADISLVAAIDDDVSRVSDIYQGALASDPTTRLDGSALEVGDFYLNTGTGNLTFLQSTGPAVWVGASALTKATQPQAEAGTNDTAYMTPLTTAQAIAALAAAAYTDADARDAQAGHSFGGVGSYMHATSNSSVTAGSNYAGSGLRPTSIRLDTGTGGVTVPTPGATPAQAGTWKAMSTTTGTTGANIRFLALFLRIA